MQTISGYFEDKKAKAKASQDAGLGGLLKVLGGGAIGLLTGGPMGALIGAGSGLIGAATGGGAPQAKDIQSALDKFNAWKQNSQTPNLPATPTYGDASGWKLRRGSGI
jgi:hypothetical protein